MAHLPFQAAILDPPQAHARFLTFSLTPGADPRQVLSSLQRTAASFPSVIGLGAPLVAAVAATLEGLRPFPALSGPGIAFPSTQGAIWAYLPGADRGEILDRALALRDALGTAARLDEEVECFKYRTGHDLSGFEDGTENPKGDAAIEAAFVSGRGPGLDGASFVAAQRYRHELARFHPLDAAEKGRIIGRDFHTNE
ncbi:MAG: Dyp-type peroxidase, partial [Byssovorax sp.]